LKKRASSVVSAKIYERRTPPFHFRQPAALLTEITGKKGGKLVDPPTGMDVVFVFAVLVK
jgi:hypothetical protein